MNSWNKTRTVFMLGLLCLMLGMFNLVLFIPKNAIGGAYLNSAHGNSSYGADRNSIGSNGFGYKTGLCIHCHEQHASIDGSEPDVPPLAAGPDKYALFDKRYTDQTDNFCLKCHDSGSSIPTNSITNHSYSYRAGGGSEFLSPADVVTAFTYYPSSGSSHNLANIYSFITASAQSGWYYNTDSNPCAACHNPHSAQGDPAHPSNRKTTTLANRGWPVSRPSQHNSNNNTWALWGDGTGEKMSDYIATGVYQAPYYYNSTTTYEPGGSTTTNGSNLTDFVSFCRDCHNTSISNTSPLGTINAIDWASASADTHGASITTITGAANPTNRAPYATPSNNYVLACTDCHEPHGSENSYLLRPEVNGTALGGSFSDGYFHYICDACHDMTVSYTVGTHTTSGVTSSSDCKECHSHGAGITVF